MVGEYDIDKLKRNISRKQLIYWQVYFQKKDDGLPEIGRIEWYLMQISKQLMYVYAGLGVNEKLNISAKEQLKIKRYDQKEFEDIEYENIKAEHEAFFHSFDSIAGKQ